MSNIIAMEISNCRCQIAKCVAYAVFADVVKSVLIHVTILEKLHHMFGSITIRLVPLFGLFQSISLDKTPGFQKACKVASRYWPYQEPQIWFLVECAYKIDNVTMAYALENIDLVHLILLKPLPLIYSFQSKIDSLARNLENLAVESMAKRSALLEGQLFCGVKVGMRTSPRPILPHGKRRSIGIVIVLWL